MKINRIAKITGGQDGAIFGHELFRFNTRGECNVFDLRGIKEGEITELQPFARFTLDRAQEIVPHSNAVCFGTEFYDPKDEYPLLYTNIYNNYAKSENKLIGVCCVYRILRDGDSFATSLVQLIEIGFCENAELWKASEEKHGARPYGNFLVDRQTGAYYAFVMRNEEKGTRYFKFNLPSVFAGEKDPVYGVKKVILNESDVLASFDCPYHRYIQGATVYEGVIYSTEGFTADTVNRPAIRMIDTALQTQTLYLDLMEQGYECEAELIDFYNGVCYYSDAHGHLFSIEF